MKNNLKVLCGLVLIGSVLGTSAVSCGKRGDSSSASESPTSQTSKDSTTESSSSDSTVEKKKMLEKLVVDTSSAKVKFNKGEAFDTTGLILRVGFSTEGKDGVYFEKLPLTSEGVTIDSSKYNKDEVGSYTISISYTYDQAIRYGAYEVSVVDEYDGQLGIDVTLDDTDAKIELSSTKTSADLTSVVSKLVVKEVLEDGTTSENAIDASKLEVSYYKDNTKLDDATSINEAGVYQVWVKTTLTRDNKTFSVSNFAFVYVINDVQSIALKTGVGTFTQEAGKDSISSTWEFVATYANGTTKELTSEDVTIDIYTKTTGDNKTATVKYEETNPLEEKVTKTVDVTYSVTKSSAATTTYVYRISADDLTTTTSLTETINFATKDAEGNSTKSIASYIVDPDNTKKSKIDTSSQSFKLRDETSMTTSKRLNFQKASTGITDKVIKLELDGASTIDLYGACSNADNGIIFTLCDSTGSAIISSDNITAKTATRVTFNVEKAGTYYISFNNGGYLYYMDITTEVSSKTVRTAETYDLSTESFVAEGTLGEFISYKGAADKTGKWQFGTLGASKYIKFDFSKLNDGEIATIKVVFTSTGSKNLTRGLGVFTSTSLTDFVPNTGVTVSQTNAFTDKVSLTYTISNKGIYYVGSYGFAENSDGTTPDVSASGGVNIYAISIDYE